MVPGIWRIVTCAAEPGDIGLVEQIIQSAHPSEIDRDAVEDVLATGDGAPRDNRTALAVKVGPGIVEVKDHWVELGTFRVQAERIVDADEETADVCRERDRAAISAASGERAGAVVVDLCGKNP